MRSQEAMRAGDAEGECDGRASSYLTETTITTACLSILAGNHNIELVVPLTCT